eukprot:COSAG03_NODE_21617_length_302_cov_0.719212_1_plen_77_part_10
MQVSDFSRTGLKIKVGQWHENGGPLRQDRPAIPTDKWGVEGECSCVSIDDCSCILDLLRATMPPGFNAYMGLYMDVR